MKIINMTPHTIDNVDKDLNAIQSLKPTGNVRVTSQTSIT